MPQFEYKVKRGADEVKTGVMEAESQRAAVATLRDMGFSPISVEQSESGGGARPRARIARRVRLKDRNVFFRQLATLLQAGMPLLRALSTVREQTGNPGLAAVIAELHEAVRTGSSLAEALEARPEIFPAMYANMVHAG